MDVPDGDICVRDSSGRIFCSRACQERYNTGEEPLVPPPIVQEYLKKQDRWMNGDVLLYQFNMARMVEEQFEIGELEEAVKLLRESKGLPHYPLDKEGNRTDMKKLYAGEAARGMLSPEERKRSA
eukprot:8390722-Karenia_brevis.AAC.1